MCILPLNELTPKVLTEFEGKNVRYNWKTIVSEGKSLLVF